MKIALICGGPSLERGISLNSARSLLDHLSSPDVEIVPFYLDAKKRPYRISPAQLYSNTPSDFDFKLRETASPLSLSRFVRELRAVDIVFPVMHGPYGEDGGIQSFLEKHRIPFVGSSSAACKRAFDKHAGNTFLKKNGFFTLPSAILKIYAKDHAKIVHDFFKEHSVQRAVVKPATGGSSIGVHSVSNEKEALDKVRLLFSKRTDTRVVLEQFAEGKEFTVILLQNASGLPVALPPTEIETSYEQNQIFDFRKKYLPTRQVAYHSPPKFDDHAIERIQAEAEQLFALFGMNDCARFDGWVLPDGNIWFCDFNTVSGMEQNSFLFQQPSRAGLTHADVLSYIVRTSCKRQGIDFPPLPQEMAKERKPVSVLFGGPTSEKEVSLMSGTNVWLKLRGSKKYEPRPYLLDTEGTIWKLPYHLTLNHTVEEISENCKRYATSKKRLEMYEERARLHLGLQEKKDTKDFFDPVALSMDAFLKEAPFVFNALHGGEGEDGTLQKLFQEHGVLFNGPNAAVSKVCIDKWATKEKIRSLHLPGIFATPGFVVPTGETFLRDPKKFWAEARRTLGSRTIIVKPRGDGCSTGVVRLSNATDLSLYLKAVETRSLNIPKGTFKNQKDLIEMPTEMPEYLLFEKYIETDILRVKGNALKEKRRSGWVEITVGVIEDGGKLHALYPSIAIAEGEVLSVEEKFQGGTGVNLTPPPSSIMRPKVVEIVRERIEQVAKALSIEGYSRIDAFVETRTGNLLVIEVNTLPGLTPSTVLYHQALAEKAPIFPRDLLEKLIANKGY